ncbi:MAG: PRC-barrel domain-containing protein [Solirubrobacteraceae bacterium]
MVDEGLPIAYEVLEKGVLVYAADGEQVGTVDHVVAAPELDIFHGIVMKTGIGPRFIAADQVASLHERGVDLRIPASEVKLLPHPQGAAPAYREREPGVNPHSWQKFVDMLSGKGPLNRNWSKED